MRIEYCDILRDLHIALDEVTGSDAKEDDFATDMDTELRQAVNSAVEQLLVEVGEDLIDMKQDLSATVTKPAGDDTIIVADVVLPSDYMRLSSIRFTSWPLPLTVITEPSSDRGKMQSCKWTRGTTDKPVILPATSSAGSKIFKVYSIQRSDSLTDFAYVPKPVKNNAYLTCALHDEAYKAIMYRAAAIFLDTHREEAASKYYELSKVI